MSTKNGSANGALGQRDEVRVAVVGVGNCASSFVQGVQYYRDADPNDFVPGLMHVDLGGYHVGDVTFTAAFDIDADKVGKDLSEAIWSGQNNTFKFSDVPSLGVQVDRGMTHDGLGKYLKEKIRKAPGETADIVGILRDTQTDVVVSYLPSTASPSSSRASRTGRSASSRPGCRSSVTTSSRRWARRSSTARSRGCSGSAACASSARAS
jgi:myo-inositol-1-phosphate synthase